MLVRAFSAEIEVCYDLLNVSSVSWEKGEEGKTNMSHFVADSTSESELSALSFLQCRTVVRLLLDDMLGGDARICEFGMEHDHCSEATIRIYTAPGHGSVVREPIPFAFQDPYMLLETAQEVSCLVRFGRCCKLETRRLGRAFFLGLPVPLGGDFEGLEKRIERPRARAVR